MKNFQEIMQMGQQMQAKMQQMQNDLTNKTVTSTSGGGMVTVTADGKGQLKSIKIDPSVVNKDDVEMLEDLVLAAVAEVQKRAETLAQDEMKKMYGGLNLPFNIPGFGG